MWNRNLADGSKKPIENISEEIKKLNNISIDAVVFIFTPPLEGIHITSVFAHIDNIYMKDEDATVIDVANYFKNRNIIYMTKFRNKKGEPLSERLKYFIKYLLLKKNL